MTTYLLTIFQQGNLNKRLNLISQMMRKYLYFQRQFIKQKFVILDYSYYTQSFYRRQINLMSRNSSFITQSPNNNPNLPTITAKKLKSSQSFKNYLAMTSPLKNLSNVKQQNLLNTNHKNDILTKFAIAKGQLKRSYKELSPYEIKANSVIYSLPQFSPPQVNFEVVNTIQKKMQEIKNDIIERLPDIKSANYVPRSSIQKYFRHRTAVKDLQNWLKEALKNPPLTYQHSIEYKNNIMGIGMKELIRIMGQRCAEQGHMAEEIWDLTWSICREIILYLSKRAKKCQQILEQELDELKNNYNNVFTTLQTTANQLKTQNEQLNEELMRTQKQLNNLRKKNKDLKIQNAHLNNNIKDYSEQYLDTVEENLRIYMQIGDKTKKDWVRKMYRQIQKVKTNSNKVKFKNHTREAFKRQTLNNTYDNSVLDMEQFQNPTQVPIEQQNQYQNQTQHKEEIGINLAAEFAVVEAGAQTDIKQKADWNGQTQIQYKQFGSTLTQDFFQSFLIETGMNTEQIPFANAANKKRQKSQSTLAMIKKKPISIAQVFKNKVEKSQNKQGKKTNESSTQTYQGTFQIIKKQETRRKQKQILQIMNSLEQMKSKGNNETKNLPTILKDITNKTIQNDKESFYQGMENSQNNKINQQSENQDIQEREPEISSKTNIKTPKIQKEQKNSKRTRFRPSALDHGMEMTADFIRSSKSKNSTYISDIDYKNNIIEQIQQELVELRRDDDQFASTFYKQKNLMYKMFSQYDYYKLFFRNLIDNNNEAIHSLTMSQLNAPEHNLQNYFQAVKQTLNGPYQSCSFKYAKSIIEKHIYPVFVEYLKIIKKAYKENTVSSLYKTFPSLPNILYNKFYRKYGVKNIASKHIKNLLVCIRQASRNSPKQYMIVNLLMFTDCKKSTSEDLFVFLLLIGVMDPSYSNKLLQSSEISTIKRIGQQYLTRNEAVFDNFSKLIKNANTYAQNPQKADYEIIQSIKFINVITQLISNYRMEKVKRIQQMGFLHLVFKDSKTDMLSLRKFLCFLVGLPHIPLEEQVKIMKNIMNICDVKQRNTQIMISQSAFSTFLIRSPQFNLGTLLQYLDQSENSEQITTEQLWQQSEALQLLNLYENAFKQTQQGFSNIKCKIGSSLQKDIIEFLSNQEDRVHLSAEQRKFLIKYLISIKLQRQTQQTMGVIDSFNTRKTKITTYPIHNFSIVEAEKQKTFKQNH